MAVAIAAAVVLLLLGAGCCCLTQPTFTTIAPRAPGASVDPARVEADVRTLVGFSPRDVDHPQALDRAADWIRGELAAAGGRVTEQPFTVNGTTYRNVIARFGPDEGARVIVGAHYDVAGPFPGADDNASGIAGALAIARLLGGESSLLARPVDVVAWTLEEPPIWDTEQMGSRVEAAALKKDGAKVRAVIVLEMIGTFSDAPGSQQFPSALLKPLYPHTGNFIGVIGRMGAPGLSRRVKRAMRGAGTIPVKSMNGPTFIPGVDFSDHKSFWREGYPALMVTDTAFYRNPRYHTADDSPDRLDYVRMAATVAAVHQAVLDQAR